MKKLSYFKRKNKYESIYFYLYLKRVFIILYVVLLIFFSSFLYAKAIASNRAERKVYFYSRYSRENMKALYMPEKKYKNVEFNYFKISELEEKEDGLKILEKYNCKDIFYEKNISGTNMFGIFVYGNLYNYQVVGYLYFSTRYTSIMTKHFGGIS